MQEREYIAVPYKEKDEAKGLGARYDGDKKLWYVPDRLKYEQKQELRNRYSKRSNQNTDSTSNHNADIHSTHNADDSTSMLTSDNKSRSMVNNNQNADVSSNQHIDENPDSAINIDGCNAGVSETQNNQYIEEKENHYIDEEDLFSPNITPSETLQDNQDADERSTHLNDENIECADNQARHNTSADVHQDVEDTPALHMEEKDVQHIDDYKGETDISDNRIDSREDLSRWDKALQSNTLNIVYMIKKDGLPNDKVMRGRIFRRLKKVNDGDYPITYEGLKVYCPETFSQYPTDDIKEKIRSIAYGGDYKRNIETSDMAPDEKGLLLFILP